MGIYALITVHLICIDYIIGCIKYFVKPKYSKKWKSLNWLNYTFPDQQPVELSCERRRVQSVSSYEPQTFYSRNKEAHHDHLITSDLWSYPITSCTRSLASVQRAVGGDWKHWTRWIVLWTDSRSENTGFSENKQLYVNLLTGFY